MVEETPSPMYQFPTPPDLWDKLEVASQAIRSLASALPHIVIVTGSGLGGLLDHVSIDCWARFADLPHFAVPTVDGHSGRLVIGTLGRIPVIIMAGRLHSYEGYSVSETVFPVRALAHAGATTFLLLNAAGALRKDFLPGDLVLIRDHINMSGTNPLVGHNDPRLGPRFLPMNEVYDKVLSDAVLQAGSDLGTRIHEGVYVGVLGPTYESAAEAQMYARLGGDIAGMSTVPEAIALRHMGRRVVAISAVTNLAAGLTPQPPSHAEVLETAALLDHKLARIVSATISMWHV